MSPIGYSEDEEFDKLSPPNIKPCPFCSANWDNLDIVAQPDPDFAIINPLDPVTPGHVLVIAKRHTQDASKDFLLTSKLMHHAAEYIAAHDLQANIITSIGPLATQTVMHTHLHVVPRRRGDGLHLPWTGQVKHENAGGEIPSEA